MASTNNKPHLVLNNPRGEKKHFNAARPFVAPETEPTAPEAYAVLKNKLSHSLTTFKSKIEARVNQRTIDIPIHLEYIEVHFFIIFNDNEPFKTKSKFKGWGMSPVLYTNFNQSVIFAIVDKEKFNGFVSVLDSFINSDNNTAPQGTSYGIAAIIYDFEFLSSDKILSSISDDVLFSLVNRENIEQDFDLISRNLINHLQALKEAKSIKDYFTDEHSTIEIVGVSSTVARTIVQNFDIIYKAQSLRVPIIRGNEYNQQELSWNLDITPPPNNVVIGVLDNGVRRIAPLENIVYDSDLDITNKINPDATIASETHGTIVASLAAVGVEIFETNKISLQADAYILPIKILNFNVGSFNIYEIERLIVKAIKKGVRIFNLSVCGPTKQYNSLVSEYAYLLDKLSYNYDILIFIATGNLDEDDIYAMQDDDHPLHSYPNHFYNPNDLSDYHACEGTNICVPSESYNNITVGAIAENFRRDTQPHLTPFKELPAYYTRKHYIDPLKKINGTIFQDSQKNKNLNKPDIVMPGGDRINTTGAMQVLGFGLTGTDFYQFDSGTSLSAPLAANLAAKILGQYPDLNMQSVKALILNSSKPLLGSEFLNELVIKIKEEESLKDFRKPISELNDKQKRIINSKFNSDSLYKHLVGFGTPIIEKAIFSDDKSVTLIIQDTINTKTHKVVNINIPKYLLKYSKSAILTLEATLCYKIPPVWGNQLGYNPLHISFNLANSIKKNNPSETAEIISNRDHDYFASYYVDGMTPEEKSKKRKEVLGIKKELKSWSEDFFPASNKPFSNVQHLSLKITKEEIRKIGNQISLAIRCTHKPDLEKTLNDFIANKPHDFSIVLNISENPNSEFGGQSLYDQLCSENDLIAANELSVDTDLNLDLDL